MLKGSLACLLIPVLTLFVVACSDYDNDLVVSGRTGVIKAQISLSFSNSNAGKSVTRQSDATVQSAQTVESFRGISGVKLIPFLTTDGNVVGTENATRNGANLVLPVASAKPTISIANTVAAASTALNSTADHAQTYADVDIQMGTNAFLFYGAATPQADGTATDNIYINHINGALAESGLTGESLSGISFSHVPIATDETGGKTTQSGDTKAAAINTYLTNIAKASGWSSSTGNLKLLYDKFLLITSGSSANIQAAVQQLYVNVYRLTDAVSQAIVTAITDVTYASAGKDSENNPTGTLTFTDAISGYPANIGLPDGAASIEWNATSSAFETQWNTTNMGSKFTVSDATDYVYPAPLYYFGNTTISTSNAKQASNYGSKSKWSDVLDLYTNGNIITTATKSVVLVNPINYAVGRLDVKVLPSTDALLDNESVSFNVSSTNTSHLFPVTGVLVGNQNQTVDWQFIPAAAGGKTIYDCDIPSGMYLQKGNTVTNHTLCFETIDDVEGTGNTDGDVYIAVEFQNNSTETISGYSTAAELTGKVYHLIPPGCKFYLIGKLDPWANTTAKYTGTETLIKKAFVRDYVTTVTLSVGSLKNAYNTLPDLRMPQLELGLSVDLSWQQGITQTIAIE